jgi:SNF2 family DNA or RNA helicase
LGDLLYFKQNYIKYKKGTGIMPVIAGYKNKEKLKRIIAKYSIRFRKVDCLDLPDKVFIEHLVPMSDAQKEIYTDLEEQFIAELPSGNTVSINHIMAKYMRLQQVTSGFVGSGAESEYFDLTRLQHLDDLVKSIDPENNKVIIWCSYTPSIKKIADRYRKYNPALFYGEVKDKQAEIDKFNEDDTCRVMVGNSKVGIGCTLNAASYAIYYELPYFDTEAMLQSQDRNHRIGQTADKVTYYTMISPGTIDRTIERNLSKKFKLAEYLTGDDLKKIARGEV